MLRIRNTVRDQGNTRAVLVDRYQPERDLLILRGIEAGDGISLEVVSNDPAAFATSEKVIRISANTNLPEGGEEGEVLTIDSSGNFIWTLPPGAGGGEANTGTNLAGDVDIYAGKVGSALQFKGISGGSGIVASESGTTITLAVDEGDLDLAGMSGNLPTPLGGTGRTAFPTDSLLVGNGSGGLNVTPVASTGYLYYNGSAFSWATPTGEANLGASLGGTAAVFANKSGVTLNFRGISAGNAVLVTQGVNNILIAVDPSALDLEDLSGTLLVGQGGTGRTFFPNNTLVVGNDDGGFDVTPVAANGYLRFNNGAFSWETPPSGETNIGASLGGSPIYAGKTASTLNFRGLTATGAIQITQTATDLALSLDQSAINIANTTGTLPLNRGGTGATSAGDARIALGLGSMATQNAGSVNITGGVANLTTLTVGGATTFNGVSYTWPVADGGAGQILSTDGSGQFEWIDAAIGGSGEVNTGASIGGATAVFVDKSGVQLRFRGLTGSSAISLTQNADHILFELDESAIDLNNTTGNLPVSRGGTGQTTLSSGALLIGNGTNGILAADLPTNEGSVLSYSGGEYVWAELPEAGEVATAISLAGEADVFAQKIGTEFQFRGISGGSAITAVESGDFISISVDPSEIDIADTTGNLGVTRGGTGQTTVAINGILIGNGANALNTIAVPGLADTYLRWNGTGYQWSALPDAGETNTASSLGTGAEVFAQKNAEDLEFRSLTGSAAISVTQGASEIAFDLDQSAIDITNTTGSISVARGGTGLTAFGTNTVLLGNGASGIAETTAASTGYLYFDGAAFSWNVPTATIASLDDIGDVDVADATAGNILSFDGTNWIPLPPPTPAGDGEANTGLSLGGEAGIYRQKIGEELQFRGLTAGTAITLAENDNDVVVAVDASAIDITDTTGTLSVGRGGTGQTSFINNSLLVGNGGTGFLSTPAAVEGQFLTFSGGVFAWALPASSGVASLDDVGDVDVATAEAGQALVFDGTNWIAQDIASGGDATTASNLGTGSQVFAQKNGDDLEFRTLSEGTGVTITQNANDIEIAADFSGLDLGTIAGTVTVPQGGTGATTMTDGAILLGSGTDPVSALTVPTAANTFLRWSGTAYEWVTVTAGTGEANEGASLGGTADVFAGMTGTTLNFRGISGTDGILVVENANDISIVVDEAALDLGAMGGVVGIAQGGTGATSAADARTALELGTLATQDADAVAITGGSATLATLGVTGATTFNGIAYTWPVADGDDGQVLATNGAGSFEWITIATGAGEANAGASLGGEQAVYTGMSGTNLQFRGVTSGNGIDLTADAAAITVTVDETELNLANMGGTLNVAQGGTGATTFTANSLLVGNGTGAVTATPAGVEGQYLQFVGGAFVWSAVEAGTNDYNDLINTPTFATVATTGSYNDLLDQPTLFSGAYGDLTGAPTLATVATTGSYADLIDAPAAFSGDYNDLINTPTLFSGSYNDLTDTPTLFSGDYGDLTGAPALAAVATSGNYADLVDQPLLFSGAYADLTGAPTLATVATTGSYNDLLDQPVLFSGDYADLANAPTLFSGNYADLVGAPTLATVATTGSYNDLSDTPAPGQTNNGTALGADPAVYAGMAGTSLTFRGIGAASNRVTTAVSGDTNSVDIDVVEANLSLNNIGGTLSVGKGGTGATTFTANGVLIGDGTDALSTTVAPTASNTYLRWSGTAFEWASVSGGTGGAEVLDDLTDVDLTTPPDSGDVLAYDGTNWSPAAQTVTVADGGTVVGTQPQINFTGAGVTVTEDAGNGRIDVDIPGGGGGGGGIQIHTFRVNWNPGGGFANFSNVDPIFTNLNMATQVVEVTHTKGTPPMQMVVHGFEPGASRMAVIQFNATMRIEYNPATTGATFFRIPGVSVSSVSASTAAGAYAIFYIYWM